MMNDEIILKSKHSRLCERITLCAEPELKTLYDECMKYAEVAEDLRRYLRSRLPLIKAKVEQQSA